MAKDRENNLKVKKDKENFQISEELIVNSNLGIFIFEKKEEKDNLMIYNNNEEINKSNIDNYFNKWNKNPFKCKERLSCHRHYDIVQVNFKYLAGTINNYLYLYSMETYEKTTQFEIKTSYSADRVISMLLHDILCIGGDDIQFH